MCAAVMCALGRVHRVPCATRALRHARVCALRHALCAPCAMPVRVPTCTSSVPIVVDLDAEGEPLVVASDARLDEVRCRYCRRSMSRSQLRGGAHVRGA